MVTRVRVRKGKKPSPIKLLEDGLISNTGTELGYCRKCRNIKKLKIDFFSSYSYLDTNEHLSVCKECVNEMYNAFFENEHTTEKAIYKLCKLLDIKYDERAIEASAKHMSNAKEAGRTVPENIFGIYKMKLVSIVSGQGLTNRGITSDFSFQENPIIVSPEPRKEGDEDIQDLQIFWGTHFDVIDISFLENEFSKLKKTHKADTYAEITLAKEVCFKVLEIQKLRVEGKSTANAVKELQEIMKNLAISPNMANALSEGQSVNAFGVWVKDIENVSPAEWYKDKQLFKDVDNLQEYGEMFITRPLRNFITGSRDFTLELESTIEEEEVD